ncbi:pyridoxamine 5'-phosphate oxidase family protein [Streptomyces sp. NBC_00280]|uniref:pyridoxamine 5'-phosphate oxidase family protein n=1 Tax=Streptomyces sp. NBC_00280 TaxID=2975699 RepID=UPI00324C41D3
MTTTDSTPLGRTRLLLEKARYLNLATVSPEGQPWVATLEYAWQADPLRFVFGSAGLSRHGLNIAHTPAVSGTLFVAPSTPGLDVGAVDGAQFTGTCGEIPADQLGDYYSHFYRAVFPDPTQREQFRLQPSQLRSPAPHRLYVVIVEEWWLIDTRTWERDRIDRRMEVPLTELSATALRGGRSRPSEERPVPIPMQGNGHRTPTGQGR